MKKYAFFLKNFQHPFTTLAKSKKEALAIFKKHTSAKTSGKEKFLAIQLK